MSITCRTQDEEINIKTSSELVIPNSSSTGDYRPTLYRYLHNPGYIERSQTTTPDEDELTVKTKQNTPTTVQNEKNT